MLMDWAMEDIRAFWLILGTALEDLRMIVAYEAFFGYGIWAFQLHLQTPQRAGTISYQSVSLH